MEEWNNPKFQRLLTPNIWKSSYTNIKDILKMPEWQEQKFEGLLTSNIWKNSFETIKSKMLMPCFKDQKYQHLLVPSIFSISISNIEKGISLFEKYGISQYITNKCLRLETTTLELLINYLIDNNISLLVEDGDNIKLNPILSCEKGKLKEKYNIDLEEIRVKKYGSR